MFDVSEYLKKYEWHMRHGYKWFTADVAYEYQNKYKNAIYNGENELEVRYTLSEELERIYGLTELEALNVITGHNVRDYIAKYELIRTINTIQKKKSKVDNEEEDENVLN